jgi:hypothetical protein
MCFAASAGERGSDTLVESVEEVAVMEYNSSVIF